MGYGDDEPVSPARRRGGRRRGAGARGAAGDARGTGASSPEDTSRRSERPPAREADPESRAREIVLRQLSDGPRTRAVLAAVLARREVPEALAAAVLDRFTELGYIDDEAYASAWVRARAERKGLSRRALAVELRGKGIDEELVAGALETLDPADEAAGARAVVERRLRTTRDLPQDVRLRRLTAMLARKGHSPGLAFRIVREALAAEDLDARAVGGVDDS